MCGRFCSQSVQKHRYRAYRPASAEALLAEVTGSLPAEALSAALHQDRDRSPEQVAEEMQELLEAVE